MTFQRPQNPSKIYTQQETGNLLHINHMNRWRKSTRLFCCIQRWSAQTSWAQPTTATL